MFRTVPTYLSSEYIFDLTYPVWHIPLHSATLTHSRKHVDRRCSGQLGKQWRQKGRVGTNIDPPPHCSQPFTDGYIPDWPLAWRVFHSGRHWNGIRKGELGKFHTSMPHSERPAQTDALTSELSYPCKRLWNTLHAQSPDHCVVTDCPQGHGPPRHRPLKQVSYSCFIMLYITYVRLLCHCSFMFLVCYIEPTGSQCNKLYSDSDSVWRREAFGKGSCRQIEL